MAKGANRQRMQDEKERRNSTRKVNEKFVEEYKNDAPPLKPMNGKQKQYIELLRSKDMVIATGLAGTSKTYIPTVMACDDLRCGYVDKIYLTRPPVSNSKSLGYFGGDLVEKMSNWLLPVLSIMHERLGHGAVECQIKKGNIAFVPLETIKGASFNKAWVICDEAEDLTYDEIKKVTTRVGVDTKFVLAGDISQSELKQHSGLRKLAEIVDNRDSLKSRVGLIDFNNPSDIVRSDLCRELILAYREEDNK